VNPGRQHLTILEELCRTGDARGDLVSDAVIAALAVEAGATVITYDRDFSRFTGLRWSAPR
jgi:predicted nucleic acid-binding protein